MQNRFRDWGDVRLFLAVARKGSTLAASREVGMTQTTVARRIDSLEHALGLLLFDRDTRGFRLTAEGAALLAPAEALEAAARGFATAAGCQTQAPGQPIRFTAWGAVMSLDLAGIFEAFSAADPGVTFEFLVSERPLDLSGGEADVALRLGNRIADTSLICRRLGAVQWTYYASDRYATTRGLPDMYREDMEAHTVILLRHISTRRKNLLLCDSAAELLMAIRSGRGIGPLPILQGDNEPGLVRCFAPPEGAELTAWLLTSPAAHRRPEVRRFTAFAAPKFAACLWAAA